MGEKSSPTKFRGEKNAKKYWEENNTNQPPRDLSLLEMSWTSKKKCPPLKNNQPPTNRTLRVSRHCRSTGPGPQGFLFTLQGTDHISRQKGKGKNHRLKHDFVHGIFVRIPRRVCVLYGTWCKPEQVETCY